jgi:hypothetical protein
MVNKGMNIVKYGGFPPRVEKDKSEIPILEKYGIFPPNPSPESKPSTEFSVPENEDEIGNPLERFSEIQIISGLIKEVARLKKRVKELEEKGNDDDRRRQKASRMMT